MSYPTQQPSQAQHTPPKDPLGWMTVVLLLAAAYNILFGGWVVLFPDQYFNWVGMTPPAYIELWQCIGMIVGVYGIGYFIAAFSPLSQWPIVLVGFLGKIFGPIGFSKALITATLPLSFGWILITNDLIWWIPFFLILKAAWQFHTQEDPNQSVLPLEKALKRYQTQQGQSLWDLSHETPCLLVCLRHFGCTFCREMIADVMANKAHIKELTPVYIFTGKPDDAAVFFNHYSSHENSEPIYVADPERTLYKSLGLHRGKLSQLFGLSVWKRGIEAGLQKSHGLGRLQGDGFQLPGVFVIQEGGLVYAQRFKDASEQINFSAIAQLKAKKE
ncbi:MAG: AhpC/TSA family protein [Cyanobacteria bacterium P01_H01_bin.74]